MACGTTTSSAVEPASGWSASTTATPANVFENIRPMVTRLIGIETVRRVRDEIRGRVETLLAELLAA